MDFQSKDSARKLPRADREPWPLCSQVCRGRIIARIVIINESDKTEGMPVKDSKPTRDLLGTFSSNGQTRMVAVVSAVAVTLVLAFGTCFVSLPD